MENDEKISSSITKAVVKIMHSVYGGSLIKRDEEPYELIKTLLYRSNMPQHVFNGMDIEVLTLPFNLFYKKYGDIITPYNEEGKRGGLHYISTTSQSFVVTNDGSEDGRNGCDDDDIEHSDNTVSYVIKADLCKNNDNDCIVILSYPIKGSYMEAVDIIHSNTNYNATFDLDTFATIMFLNKYGVKDA